jgi:NAD-dependent dihydropyrimidine dehydrogenase PreA subunit
MGSDAYTIVADVCEGAGDCISVCPVECISWADGQVNVKGTKFAIINPDLCLPCGACLNVCPVEGAILDEWKPELQQTKSGK